MAFSLTPDGIKGANGYFPYDNGGTTAGQYAISANNSDAGWVYLGAHQASTPYPKNYFKIAAPDNAQGTLEYEIWNNGDANHEAGGLHLVRLNQWYSGQGFFTSVFFRCLGGNRTDTRLHAFRSSDGIWISAGFIWGAMYIRRRGKDDRNWPSSSYCAVANGGALSTVTTLPSGGVQVDADGGYDIEDQGVRNG